MKVKLTRKKQVYGKTYPKGATVEVAGPYGRRLIHIGDAESSDEEVSKSEGTPLPKGLPMLDKIKAQGYSTVEEVLAADLTEINGIAEKTEADIKDALR